MAVDPRAKGARFEYQIRDMLVKATGLEWLRVPGSGAYSTGHSLKGDVYLSPASGKISTFTIEAKHYADEAFNSNIFKSSAGNIGKWWAQTLREAEEMNAKPLLVFKKDRGHILAAMNHSDFAEIAHLIETPTMTMNNKWEEPVTFFMFKDLLENAQEHLYR